MCMYVCIVITFSRLSINRFVVNNPACGQLNRKKMLFSCPRSRLRIWFRETGSTSCVSPLILPTQAESSIINHQSSIINHQSGAYSRVPHLPPAFRDGVHLLHRQPPSDQSRAYRATQSRADGVYRRESSGTRPIVVKVARTGSSYDTPYVYFFVRLSFPTPIIINSNTGTENMHDTDILGKGHFHKVTSESSMQNTP